MSTQGKCTTPSHETTSDYIIVMRTIRKATSQKGFIMKKANFVYSADHVECVVYVDVESMKRAGQITSPEFAEYKKIKEALPGYKFQTKEFPKKAKQTYAGLKIAVMQAFIIQCEDTTEKAEAAIRELNKAKAKGMLKGGAYGGAKSWFLENYGKEYRKSAMSKKDGKRVALIKELLSKVNPSLVDSDIDSLEEEGV